MRCATRFRKSRGVVLLQLQAAGIEVEVGLKEAEARRLNAPYLKRLKTHRPWVIAKWAMTLDGKIATHSGHSQWISSDESRALAHSLRGRMDAILIGGGTAKRDDPLLTARPPGARIALRGDFAILGAAFQQQPIGPHAREVPLLVVISPQAPEKERQRLLAARL